jgi:hypothetical protein
MLFIIKRLSFVCLNVFNIVIAAIIKTDSNDVFLTHYWPFENGQMTDQIGFKDMTQGKFTEFTSDRFGFSQSALALKGGFTRVDQGAYFDTLEFTISVWVYPHSVGRWARVIDFGNDLAGVGYNNVILSLDSDSSKMPAFQIFGTPLKEGEAISSSTLKEKRWQFLTATFDGKSMCIYIDSNLMGSQPVTYEMPKISRTVNYIGESSNSWYDGESDSYLDDLRFYNKSLNQSEINSLMNLPG